MRVVIQRVAEASVRTTNGVHSSIGRGLVILVGVEHSDTEEDVDWITGKIARIRVFDDEKGLMNRGILDAGGEILVVSQFTLHASTKKGNRPSFQRAAPAQQAIRLYQALIGRLESTLGCPIQTGVFGAQMQVSLINDGPVTILIDSKTKE